MTSFSNLLKPPSSSTDSLSFPNPPLLDPQTTLPPPPPQPAGQPTKRLRLIRGFVAEVAQEAFDTWTLHIFVGEHERDYLAGQFISIDPHQFPELSEAIAYLEHKKGRKELVRAYSMASIPSEPYVSITIKPERYEPGEMEYPPLLSPLLASSALKGRPIEFLGYTGAYTLAADHGERTKEVLHLVAGSGIVPNYALLKEALEQDKKNTHVFHTLIDVNKTHDDIIFQKQLKMLAEGYPERFRLIHLLTRDAEPRRHGPYFFSGRPTKELVREQIKDPSQVLVYACGAAVTKWQKKSALVSGVEPTPRFLESISEIIASLGIDKKRFKKEVYG